MMPAMLLPESFEGLWKVTTAHGSKAFFDFDDMLWQRVPKEQRNGFTNFLGYDNEWLPLRIGPRSFKPGERERPDGIRVGWGIHYGRDRSVSVWSTDVEYIRRVSDEEVPPTEVPILLGRQRGLMSPVQLTLIPPGKEWALGAPADLPVLDVFGGSREEVIEEFAHQVDEWIGGAPRQGAMTRTRRAWASRQVGGSVRAWLEDNLDEA